MKTKKTILSFMLIFSGLALEINAADVDKILQSLNNIYSNFANDQSGIGAQINKLIGTPNKKAGEPGYEKGYVNNFRYFMKCVKVKGDAKKTTPSGATVGGKALTCEETLDALGRRFPIDTVQLVLNTLRNFVIGSEKVVGALLFEILNILQEFNVPNVADVKSIANKISDILERVNVILDSAKQNLPAPK